ncbi:MAG: sugar transferase [Erysipelotrichaceae bacterium]|nr:sugar transferase [Erysipelotrichaceae bacterium]
MYRNFFKRLFDFILSLTALIVLAPVFVVLIVLGYKNMKGNPFFTQERPGKDEKIFRLIKFRTMSEEKDENGNYLSDDIRLNSYGKKLRSTSLDELPELFNILKGDMAIVGPRPLLVKYLPLYNEEQRHRHDVRPGLTGLAQVNGRNLLSWQDKFRYDIDYVNNITLLGDIRIILKTVKNVLSHEGINAKGSSTAEEFKGNN